MLYRALPMLIFFPLKQRRRDMLKVDNRYLNSEDYSTVYNLISERRRISVTTEDIDSGMEDGSHSPVSSIDSEPQEFPKDMRMLNAEQEITRPIYPMKPTVLTHSEGSAFNKIDKWTPSYNSTFGSLAPICVPPSMGYFPGLFISPWMHESISRGYLNPISAGVHGKPVMTAPQCLDLSGHRTSDSDESVISSPEKQQYFHVDPRIPFTNYFMNLTKMFQKETGLSAAKQSDSKCVENNNNKEDNRNLNESISGDEECPDENRPIIKTEPEVTKNEEEAITPSYFQHRHSESKMSYSIAHPRMSLEKQPNSLQHRHMFHGSTSLPGMERLTSFPPPIGSAASMLPFLGGIPPSSGLYHPAFLQMSGLGGNKRGNLDKPAPVKKYKCDVCGKAFSRSNTLVTHKRIHTGDKPFKCEVCGRAFRQPGNLTRHRLTHTTVKPYVCPQCNKAFNRASNLHTHMRTHTNFKPFVCPYCGKGFHQKIDMKIHCYTHTGERPHRCDVCGKGFSLISTLTTHKRIHYDTSYPLDHMTGTGNIPSACK